MGVQSARFQGEVLTDCQAYSEACRLTGNRGPGQPVDLPSDTMREANMTKNAHKDRDEAERQPATEEQRPKLD